MQLSVRRIKNLPVGTKSGQILGKIKDFEVNSETQAISKYLVKSNKLAPLLIAPELIIDASQVISLTDKQLTVEDAVVKEGILAGQSAMAS
ncbi:MAG: PRC-barrel domain-containing protein [Candidatus Komeilibacteria bacterium]|nr:PRC-barrel domain-containing protein [Candidatus Komeilibacteria bacterium]